MCYQGEEDGTCTGALRTLQGPKNGPEDKWTDFICQYCNLDLHNSTLDLHIACTGFPILIETVKSDSSVSLNLDLQFEVHNLVLSVGDKGCDSI